MLAVSHAFVSPYQTDSKLVCDTALLKLSTRLSLVDTLRRGVCSSTIRAKWAAVTFTASWRIAGLAVLLMMATAARMAGPEENWKRVPSGAAPVKVLAANSEGSAAVEFPRRSRSLAERIYYAIQICRTRQVRSHASMKGLLKRMTRRWFQATKCIHRPTLGLLKYRSARRRIMRNGKPRGLILSAIPCATRNFRAKTNLLTIV